jgi:hypothetical protein
MIKGVLVDHPPRYPVTGNGTPHPLPVLLGFQLD